MEDCRALSIHKTNTCSALREPLLEPKVLIPRTIQSPQPAALVLWGATHNFHGSRGVPASPEAA